MKDLKIYNAISGFSKRAKSRLCMPGHKGNSKGLKKLTNYRLDVTELDVIGNASVVERAEQDCAKLLNAKRSFLLCDGTSLGILSIIHAVRGLGKKLIVSRNSHISVFNALKLFSIEPIFIGKEEHGIMSLPTLQDIEDNLDDDTIGALITTPDYFGRTCDLKGIKEVLNRAGKLLLIDGAHGAHLPFSDTENYMGRYADVWVMSAHKTLETLNQGSVILVNHEGLVDEISQSVKIFATTSPSYLILGSVEYGIKKASESRKEYLILKDKLQKLKDKLKGLGVETVEVDDYLKVLVDCNKSGLYSKEVEKTLNRFSIYPELVNERFILFMFSLNNRDRELKLLVRAFREAVKKRVKKDIVDKTENTLVKKLSYLTAVNSEYELVSLDDAKDRIAYENLGVFPPCYPTVIAGEVITSFAIDILKTSNVFGVYNGQVKVVKEN